MKSNPTKEELELMAEQNGGNLNLRRTQITALPDNLTIGGSLELAGMHITNEHHYKKLKDGDYVPGKYLYADGILTHVKDKTSVNQYTYYYGKIEGRNVIQKGDIYAHCKSFKDGVLEIEFKESAERGAEQYKSLTPESVVTKGEAITMYRIITGACKDGTEMFVNGLKETKEKYTIQEIIEITKGQYGSGTFNAFFRNMCG